MYDFLSLIACRTQIFRIDIGCQGRHPECLCAIRVYNATCIVMYLYAEYIYTYTLVLYTFGRRCWSLENGVKKHC